MKVCVLASSSAGNSIFVASSSTKILIDAGLSGKEMENRLNAIGETITTIDAICLTHEHSDHISGAFVLHKRYKIPLYANSATAEASESSLSGSQAIQWRIFTTGSLFKIRDLTIEPFSLSHDAADPVGFVISDGLCKVGIATDLGTPTTLVKERLKGCQIVILEFNHDEDLLKMSERPWDVKQRIAGRRGHLSNFAAKELLKEFITPSIRYLFLAHISQECNTLSLALKAANEPMKGMLSSYNITILPTYPDRPSEICSI